MNATIKKTELFDFDINGQTYTGFKKASEWNGLVEYRNGQGVIIVCNINRFEELIFGSFNQDIEVHIIQASPCFVGGE